ncbi:hypothetical protein [Bradyrhizobium sp.]|uniref:hypothetical protein n=1 Tax=Bradyrhizobium sp. TaxID=376 RepID=UPI003BAEF4DD
MSSEFLEKVQKSYERHTGEAWSPEKTLQNFPLYGRQKRIEALSQIDEAVKDADTSNLRQYTKLTRLQREVELQQMLLKNGR